METVHVQILAETVLRKKQKKQKQSKTFYIEVF